MNRKKFAEAKDVVTAAVDKVFGQALRVSRAEVVITHDVLLTSTQDAIFRSTGDARMTRFAGPDGERLVARMFRTDYEPRLRDPTPSEALAIKAIENAIEVAGARRGRGEVSAVLSELLTLLSASMLRATGQNEERVKQKRSVLGSIRDYLRDPTRS